MQSIRTDDDPTAMTATLTQLRLPHERRVLGGRYQVRRMIGRGGTADVYLGDDLLLERTVAIKILHPKFASETSGLERFRREATTLAAVRSPHVVGVYDIGLAAESVYLVMEHVEGQTIEHEVARTGKMSMARAETILRQVLEGLAEMHGQGLVHRDIKPSNVLVDGNDDVVLLDLGIVVEKRRAPPTAPGKLFAGFALDSSMETELTNDVYQVGLLMMFLLTGEELGWRAQPKHLETLFRRLPAALEGVARCALHIDPTRRFASAKVMKAAVESALDRSTACEPALAQLEAEPQHANTKIAAVGLQACVTQECRAPVAPWRELRMRSTELDPQSALSARSACRADVAAVPQSEYMRNPLIEPPAPPRCRLLIVDDNPQCRNSLHRMLTSSYQVFIANDAEQARVQIEGGARFKVIVCGLTDPRAFYRVLAARFPDQAAALVFLTSTTNTEEARSFLDGVTNKRLNKPVEASNLRRLIGEQRSASRRAITSR